MTYCNIWGRAIIVIYIVTRNYRESAFCTRRAVMVFRRVFFIRILIVQTSYIYIAARATAPRPRLRSNRYIGRLVCIDPHVQIRSIEPIATECILNLPTIYWTGDPFRHFK